MILSSNESLSVCHVQNGLILPSGEKKRRRRERKSEEETISAFVVKQQARKDLKFENFNCPVKITLRKVTDC